MLVSTQHVNGVSTMAMPGMLGSSLVLYSACRKHVITEQGYIPQLVRGFEEEGVRPVPIFINGIEAHTVVLSAQYHRFCMTACQCHL